MSTRALDMLQSSVIGALLLMGLLGFVFAALLPGLDRWSRRFFMSFFAVVTLCMGANFAEQLAYGDPSMVLTATVASYLDTLLPSILMLMPTLHLLHCCRETPRTSALLRVVLLLWGVHFVLLAIAQQTALFYYYTPEGTIDYGPWYQLGMVPLLMIMATNMVGVVRRRGKLSRRRLYAFLSFLVPLTVAMLAQMATSAFLFTDVGMSIAVSAMFAIEVSEQVEQYLHLKRENAHQRASIAVLQMRPHFIHNTMASIYYLCEQDPKRAQQVTMDFNTYLRKNLAAIAQDGPIPFSEELEHTRAYLAVEQAQFASKLVIDFETPHTSFRLPPLTLQPLAENAVKHGMSPHTVPLHVCIRTRETAFGSEIVVEDDGPGFDPALADRPHTTLANIRQRLQMMCGGTLEAAAREGGGVVVTVTIPRPRS